MGYTYRRMLSIDKTHTINGICDFCLATGHQFQLLANWCSLWTSTSCRLRARAWHSLSKGNLCMMECLMFTLQQL